MGVAYVDPTTDATVLLVTSLDAAVVATTERSPIAFPIDTAYVDCRHGMHFSLFNNAWNTNYPVWSQDTSDLFRFELELTPAEGKISLE